MRPNGWDAKKIIDERIGEVTSFTTFVMLVEAGADAYEDGLKKEGQPIPEGLTNRKGYLVFIPVDG